MLRGAANMTLHAPPKIIIFGAPRSAIHPHLKTAAGSARLLGVLFLLLSVFPMLRAVGYLTFPGTMWNHRMLPVAATAMLFGPGAWYFIAARLIRQANPW